MPRAALRRAARTAVCLIAGCTVVAVLGVPARADTTDQQVSAVLARVHQLQVQTDAALGRYQDALHAIAGAVTTQVTSQQHSDAASGAATRAQQRLDARVRALYMAGGEAGLVSSMLSGDLSELGGRMVAVQHVMAGGRADALDARHKAVVAQRVATQARGLSTSSVTTARDVLDVAAQLSGLLAQQQQLLGQAKTEQAAQRAETRYQQAAQRAQSTDQQAAQRAQDRLAVERSAAQAITASSAPVPSAGPQNAAGPLPASAAYLALYRSAAATCPGLTWELLAAVGQVESGHGRDVSTSSAGAQGPMQFIPGTFAAYAVDGNHDGRTDIMSPADAIFTAAHFMCVHGAGTGPAGVRAALLFYNHAQWYVQLVLAVAANYR